MTTVPGTPAEPEFHCRKASVPSERAASVWTGGSVEKSAVSKGLLIELSGDGASAVPKITIPARMAAATKTRPTARLRAMFKRGLPRDLSGLAGAAAIEFIQYFLGLGAVCRHLRHKQLRRAELRVFPYK